MATPRQSTYPAASGDGVYAGTPRPLGWASGSATGTYNGGTFTLTPAKTAGVVNAASWALVPSRTYVKVAGTELTAIESEVLAAAPTWSSGQLSLATLFNSYSGPTPDPIRGRMWFTGGGHTNGWQNGLYRMDAFRMRWALEHAPSQRTAEWTSSGYLAGGTSTIYPPNKAAAAAAIAGSSFSATASVAAGTWDLSHGHGYDMLDDGRPTPRHTYQATVYDSTRDRLVVMCRRLWVYDFAAGDWIYRRALNDSSGSLGDIGDVGGTSPYLDGEHGCLVFDEATGKYLTHAKGSAIPYGSLVFDPATSAWAGGWPGITWDGYEVYQCRRGRKVVSVFFDAGLRYWEHDLDSGVTTANDVRATLAGGLPTTKWNWTSTPSGEQPQSAITYVESLDRFWLTAYTSSNTWEMFELDPTTTPKWTLSPLAIAGTLPEQPDSLYRRLTYYPAPIDAVLMLGYASAPLIVIRP